MNEGRRRLGRIHVHSADGIFLRLARRSGLRCGNSPNLHRARHSRRPMRGRKIFLRIALKLFRTASRAEVIQLVLKFRRRRSVRRINPHATHRIFVELLGLGRRSRQGRNLALGRHRSILRRRGVEFLHASRRTEKISVALVFRLPASLRWIDHHAADRVLDRKIQLQVLYCFFGLAHSFTLSTGHRSLLPTSRALRFA